MPSPLHKPYRVTQPYGPTTFASEPSYGGYAHFHRGLDLIPADGQGTGAPIYPARSGAVLAAGTDTDGARFVIVRHDDGAYEAHWHLNTVLVKSGQRVTPDTQTGTMGSTGNSTGPHLHIEFETAGPWKGLLSMTPLDPNLYLQDVPGSTGEGDDVTTKEHITYELQDIADVIGGDPHYDESQPDAFKGHVDRALSAGGLELRTIMRDFLRDGGWKNAADVLALERDRDTFAKSDSANKGETLRLTSVIKQKDDQIAEYRTDVAAADFLADQANAERDEARAALKAAQNGTSTATGPLSVGDAFSALVDAIFRRSKEVK